MGGRAAARRPTPVRVAGLDRAVDGWVESIRSPTLDHLFYGLSSAADHGLLWLSIGALQAARRGDPGGATRLGIAMGIESALTNGVVKSFFRRVRPDAPAGGADGRLPYGMRRPITSSFPSGHATSAFTAATFLSAGSGPAAAAGWFTLAAVVAFSRVYVRMHHASDVLAGVALGLVVGRVLQRALSASRAQWAPGPAAPAGEGAPPRGV